MMLKRPMRFPVPKIGGYNADIIVAASRFRAIFADSRDEASAPSRYAFSLISPGAQVLFNGVILSPLVYILVFCAAFVGSGLKAVGGFGFATLTTPTVAIFWDVPTAIAVISIPTLCTSLMNAWRTRAGRP